MTSDAPLAGQVAIITGAGSGIGRAIASEVARAGASVMLAGRRVERLTALQSEIVAFGGVAEFHATDVTSADALDSLVRSTLKTFSQLTTVINNAGVGTITDWNAPSARYSWDAAIATNLTAVFELSRLALAHLPDGGRIVNIASVLADRGAPRSAAYCASKHGVIGLTRAMALDLASRGITVNAICPGWVDTDMAHDIFEDIAKGRGVSVEEARRGAVSGIPMGRMVEAREVARLAVFLCGLDAAAITGQMIKVCCGSSLT